MEDLSTHLPGISFSALRSSLLQTNRTPKCYSLLWVTQEQIISQSDIKASQNKRNWGYVEASRQYAKRGLEKSLCETLKTRPKFLSATSPKLTRYLPCLLPTFPLYLISAPLYNANYCVCSPWRIIITE